MKFNPLRRSAAEMPFLDHLEELRWRILWSLLALLIATTGAFWFVMKVDVLAWLKRPIDPYLPEGGKLIFLEVGGAFFITLKLAITIGILLALPIVAYQAWAFLSPALTKRERRAIIPALYLGLVLFVAGVALAYWGALPLTLRFMLVTFASDSLEQSITASYYFSFVVKMLVAFGAVFELPVVVLVLSALGLVTSKWLRSKRRYAIAGMAVLSAMITPGDAISLTLFLMLPLILLYELSIGLSALVERARRKGESGVGSRESGVELKAGCIVLFVLLAGAAPASAQQQQDTVKTTRERVIERLKSARPLIAPPPDTGEVPDSLLPPDRQVVIDTGRVGRVPGNIPRDSIALELLALTGFIPTEYRAEAARFEADSGRLDLLRAAEVNRDGLGIAADTSITYFEEQGSVCARGSPTVSGGETAPVQGDSLCYDIEREIGFARGARTTVSETGAEWRVRADQLACLQGDDSGRCWGHDAIFTDCDRDYPHYHFAAKDMKVVRGQTIVARNVTLCFDDVCVAWLPFFVQSLGRDRATGILMPRFGVNDIARRNARYSRQIEDIGFYWAINDYMGAEVAMDWRSDDFTALRGSLDFRLLRQFLSGGLTYRKFWKAEGGSDFTLATMASWQPDERTRVAVDGNYATSTRFVRSRSLDPRELNRSIDTNIGLSRRFDWGSLNLKGQRNQYLTDNSVRMVLPSVGLNLSSITLFPALPGEEKWYSNMTWTASGDFRMETRGLGDENINPLLREERDWTGRATSTFSLGAFGLSQNINVDDQVDLARDIEGDTLPGLPERVSRRMQWNTTLSYQQRLIGTSTLTPGLSLRGETLRSDTTGLRTISSPTRIDFNAALRTDIFGFWPGFGPFERMRHRLSPSITYAYSPAPTVTDEQRQAFGIQQVREQNRLSIGLNQTFEVKYRAPEDTTAAGGAAADSAEAAPAPGEPRRREQGRKLTLLSLQTDAIVYDFVQAREEGDGIVTTSISNSLQSDLLRGFQLAITHDLFETRTTDETGQPLPRIERDFKPHLSRVSASFSINSNSGLARLLGLGPREGGEPAPEPTQDTTGLGTDEAGAGPAVDRTQGEMGMVGTRRRATTSYEAQPVGTWNASFSYTMFRPRDDEFSIGESQMLTATVSFQPTTNWQVNWNTGYSFTEGAFTDHILTLTRNLHDWDANFDFVKAQNGNFAFQFRVHLRANPDIKVDYEQRDLEGVERVRAR